MEKHVSKKLTMFAIIIAMTASVFVLPIINDGYSVQAATKKVTVTFKSNSGKFTAKKYTNKKSFSKKIKKGKKIGTLPKVTKTGYTLKGWYTKKSSGKKVTSKKKINKKTTLYARWNARSYTVNFDANGGNVTSKSKSIKYDSKYGTLPTPVRDNYIFLGWWTKDGKLITKDSVYKTTGNTTLSAKWSKKKEGSGLWGTARWILTSDGVLTISGGKAAGSFDSSPWMFYAEFVKKIKIEDEVILAPYSKYLFDGFINLTTIEGIGNLNFGNTFDIAGMFRGCKSLSTLDLSNIYTPNIESTESMFMGCENLESINFGSDFITDNVEDMGSMFADCSSLQTLDLTDFDTSAVRYMGSMFRECSRLTFLDIHTFDTSKVTEMVTMFGGCKNLAGLQLVSFNTIRVKDMAYMFFDCSNLTTLELGDNFYTNRVYSMVSMFENCSNLTTLSLGNHFTGKRVMEMNRMFADCSKLRELDMNNFETPAMERTDEMFKGCSALQKLNISKLSVNEVTTTVKDMFSGCNKLAELILGPDFRFYVESGIHNTKKYAALPEFDTNDYYCWELIYNATKDKMFVSSQDFMDNYKGSEDITGDVSGTYVLVDYSYPD